MRAFFSRLGLSIACALPVFVAASSARADILPDGKRVLKVEVKFDKPVDGLLVAYPTDCMGLDAKLNPQLESLQDYDVVEPNTASGPYRFCDEKTRVYVLDQGSFKKTVGEKFPAFMRSEWKLDEVSRLPRSKRGALFQTNEHVHASGYAMPAFAVVDEDSPLDRVEELVTFGGLPAKAQSVKLTYRYTDGATEEHVYKPGARPQPLRAAARDWMGGLVEEAKADAGAPPASTSTFTLNRDRFTQSPGSHNGKSIGQKPSAPIEASEQEEVDPRTKRNHRLFVIFGLVAAIATGMALRETKKKS
jgi:hypothetical protein